MFFDSMKKKFINFFGKNCQDQDGKKMINPVFIEMDVCNKVYDMNLEECKNNTESKILDEGSYLNKSNSKTDIIKINNSQNSIEISQSYPIINFVVDKLENKNRSPSKLIESISQRFRNSHNIAEKTFEANSMDFKSLDKENIYTHTEESIKLKCFTKDHLVLSPKNENILEKSHNKTIPHYLSTIPFKKNDLEKNLKQNQ